MVFPFLVLPLRHYPSRKGYAKSVRGFNSSGREEGGEIKVRLGKIFVERDEDFVVSCRDA